MANQNELEDLRQQFGTFERATFEYKAISLGFAGWVKRLTRRRGEIVLVVPRQGGRILLHTKPHYPEDVYRLPTGGIRFDEDAADAAKREGYEEIGFKPKELRLLAVLDNVFWVNGERVEYPSFVFETQALKGKPNPTDPDEPISGFRSVDADELRVVANMLAGLPMEWREWGRFRAASHAWLADRMRRHGGE